MENETHIVPADAQAEIGRIREDANILLFKAEEVAAVADTESEARAVEFLSQIKRRAKIIEAKRLQYTAPLNAALKSINNDFRTVSAPLDEAEAIVKRGITTYRSAEDFRIKEEARKKAEAEAAAALRVVTEAPTQDSLAEAQKAVAKVEAANAEAPRTVETQSGQLRTRKVTRWKVADPDAIPREYLMPDEKKIKEAINRGQTIEGIETWVETVPIIMS